MEYTNKYHEYDEIIPNLFIGNFHSLKYASKFAFIVNCTNNISFPKSCTNCMRISINDDPFDCDKMLIIMKRLDILEKIRNFVKNKQPVLVHCYAGRQRSACLIAAYLIYKYNYSIEQAYKYIIFKRKEAFYYGKSYNFHKSLLNYIQLIKK